MRVMASTSVLLVRLVLPPLLPREGGREEGREGGKDVVEERNSGGSTRHRFLPLSKAQWH